VPGYPQHVGSLGYRKPRWIAVDESASPPGERAGERDQPHTRKSAAAARRRSVADHHPVGEVGAAEHDQAVGDQHAERGAHRDQARGASKRARERWWRWVLSPISARRERRWW